MSQLKDKQLNFCYIFHFLGSGGDGVCVCVVMAYQLLLAI